MRKDMFKVIVERERRGARFKTSTMMKPFERMFKHDHSYEVDDEDSVLPSKVSMTKPYGYEGKSLNENLSPLYRFMRSKIGQKWNDIWSEICEHINSNSTVQKHVLDHAYSMVEHYIKMIDGEPWHSPRYGRIGGGGWQKLFNYSQSKYQFAWVHPETNVLMATPIYERPDAKVQKASFRAIDDNHQAHKIKGIWYIVTVDVMPSEERLVGPDSILGTRFTSLGCINDTILNTYIGSYYRFDINSYHGGKRYTNKLNWSSLYNPRGSKYKTPLYGVSKKQMNTKELNKYGLKHE